MKRNKILLSMRFVSPREHMIYKTQNITHWRAHAVDHSLCISNPVSCG